MGVLIVGGTALLGVLIVRRMSGVHPPAASVAAPAFSAGAGASGAVLDEPPGTRIAGAALAGDRIALTLQGGGPDRVTVLDLRSLQVVARVGLRP